jgi:hypothetical protein
MAVAAETAVRAWINAQGDLTASGGPLPAGAFLVKPRSPAAGGYALLTRNQTTTKTVIAEADNPSMARVSASVFAGTIEAAEAGAVALASAYQTLQGMPEPMGDSGITCLVTDNVTGPSFVPQPPDSGEQYCFMVVADFMLLAEE